MEINILRKITKNEQNGGKLDPFAILNDTIGNEKVDLVHIEKSGEQGFKVILNYDGQTYDYLEMILDYLKGGELDLLNKDNLSVINYERVLENSSDDKDYTNIKTHKLNKKIFQEFEKDIGEIQKGERSYFGYAKRGANSYTQILIDLKTGQFIIGSNGNGKRTETALFNIEDKYLLYAMEGIIGHNTYVLKLMDLSEGFIVDNKNITKLPLGYSFNHSGLLGFLNMREGLDYKIIDNQSFLEVNGVVYIADITTDKNGDTYVKIKDEVSNVEKLGSYYKKNSKLVIYKSVPGNKIYIVNTNLGKKKDITSRFNNTISNYKISTIGDDYVAIDENKKVLNMLVQDLYYNVKNIFILLNYETLELVEKIDNIPIYNDHTIRYSNYVLGVVKEDNGNLIYVQNIKGKIFLNIEIDYKKVFGKKGYDMSEVLNNPLKKYYFSHYDCHGFYKKFGVLIIEPKIDFQKEINYIIKIGEEIKLVKYLNFIDRQEDKFAIRYKNKDNVYSYIGFSLDKNGKVKIEEKTLDLTEYKDKINWKETKDGIDYFYMKNGVAKTFRINDLY